MLLLLGLPLAFLIRSATDEGWREVTSVEVLRTRDVIYLPDANVFLVNDDPPIALDGSSPHLGEPLSYCASGRNFVSLGHGELFDRSGRYLDGPAPHGMDRIGTRVRDGIVEINLRRTTTGPPLSVRGEASGQVCTALNSSLIRPGYVERDVA
jgi:hypothetical protein